MASALLTSMVSHWNFDESSGNAADSQGSNTLTNNGTVTYNTGKLSNAAYFDGSSGMYFSKSNISDFYNLFHSSDATLAGWFYFTTGSPSSGTFYSLFSQEDSTGSGTPAWNIGYGNEGGTIRFQMVTSSSGSSQVAGRINYTLSSTTWYHIAFTYVHSTGLAQIYVNGDSVGTATIDTTVKQGDGNFQIGKTNGFGNTMNGRIDSVGVWSRKLSNTEISILYNNGSGLVHPFNSGTVTANFYAGNGDGTTTGGGVGTWSQARNTGSGANYTDTTWNTLTYYSPGQWSNASSTSQQIMRYHIPVDTSYLDVGGSTSVTSAALKLWVGDNYGASIPGGAPDYFVLIPGGQASTSSVTSSDHDLTVPNSNAISSTINRTSLTTSAYNSWSLNGTGVSSINTSGYTKLCMVTGGDYENYGYNNSWVTRMLVDQADSTNYTMRPYLQITYSMTPVSPDLVSVSGTSTWGLKIIG